MTPNVSYKSSKVEYLQETLFLGSFPVCSDVVAASNMLDDDRSEQATFYQGTSCFFKNKIDQDQEHKRQEETKDCESVEAMMERHYAMLEHNRGSKDYSKLNKKDLQEIEALNELESHFKRIDSCEDLNKMGKTRRSIRRTRRRGKKSSQSNDDKLRVDCGILADPILSIISHGK